MLVLKAITGPDQADVSSVPSTLNYNAQKSVQGLKLGYFPKWFHEAPATDVDRAAFEQCKKLGMQPVEVSLPDWPYGNLNLLLFAEAAASFEQLTLSGKVDEAHHAGPRRVAEQLSPGALSLRGRLRANRPYAAAGC